MGLDFKQNGFGNFVMSLSGADAIDRMLEDLPKRMQGQVARTAVRNGAKIFEAGVERRAPVGTMDRPARKGNVAHRHGAIKRSLAVRKATAPRGVARCRVILSVKKSPELVTHNVKKNPGKRHFYPNVQETRLHFMGTAFVAERDAVLSAVRMSVETGIWEATHGPSRI